jgi:Domain of Unknown Function (DUF1080)
VTFRFWRACGTIRGERIILGMNPFFARFTRRNSGLAIAAAALLFGSMVPVSLGADNPKGGWTSLFDGSTLKGWKSTEFGGEGTVEVKDGAILLAVGNDLTGVNYQRPTPHRNYEVSLEARRVDGSDFFCGLTFPVKDDPCSLIIGGWGGGVCGLSSIDGLDASENSTTKYREFETGRWYTIRLRVTDAKIEAWIDKDQIVDQKLAGKKISIRSEVEASKPFGIASYRTLAALRNIRLRELK